MKKQFTSFASYIALYDGMGKPKINFQDMYKLFPDFTFTATEDFGQYSNFGQAFSYKNYSMIVSDGKDECYMTYKEYQDANENLAYVS